MGNIAHLVGGYRESDGVVADKMNSIVERITGVNPSVLASKVTGAEVQTYGRGASGPMPRALQVAQQQMEPQSQGYLPGQYNPQAQAQAPQQQYAPQPQSQAPHPQMQAMMERMAMLEQRVAYYEQDDGKGKDKYKNKYQQGPSNRGPESRIWGRDIDPDKAGPDEIDGVTDSKKRQKQGATKEHMMFNDVREAIGGDLTEWKKLAGLTDPYAPQPSVDLTSRDGQQPLYEDVYVQSAAPIPAPAAAPAPAAPRLNEQEFRAEMWEAFLHDRGLTVEVFGQLVDEAIESDDPDEMDALLAVEDVFGRVLEQAIDHYGAEGIQEAVGALGCPPTPGILEWMDWLEEHGMDPQEFDETIKLAEDADNERILGLCQETVRIFESSVKDKARGISSTDAGAQKIAKINKELKGFRSVANAPKPKAEPKEDPRKWAKQMNLHDDMQFEVDADENGEPDDKQIPWSRIVKSYTAKAKEERGFGGMSRVGN